MKKAIKEIKAPVDKKGEVKPKKAALTMQDLLDGYKGGAVGYKRGQELTGKVVEVTKRTVFMDVGGKTDAILAEREYDLSRDYFKTLKPGDKVTGVVLVTENDAGQVVLSLRRAATELKWKYFEQAMADDEILEVKGKGITKGGVLVEADGVFGFIPSSQLSHEFEAEGEEVTGRKIKVRVIEVDRLQNRLVFSEKAVSEAVEIEKRKDALSAVEAGHEYTGKVMGIVPFGAFIEIIVPSKGKDKKKEEKEIRLEGLVHISELSWEKVEDVTKMMKEGDLVQVQVIGMDEDTGKLALSMKRLIVDPWVLIKDRYKVDSKHSGKVTKIVPYGVLVRMEKGIEGLIHASKMPADRVFHDGDEVEVFVESVDVEKRRLSLGVVLTAKPVGYK